MSSSNSPVLQLEIRHGRTKRWLMGVMLLSAAGIPWLLAGLSEYLSLTMMTTNLSVVLLACWRAGWLGKRFRLQQVTWDGSGGFWLLDRNGRQAAALRADSVATGLFCWLKWRCADRVLQTLMFRDEYSADEWRRWRLRLRWEGRAFVGSSEPQ